MIHAKHEMRTEDETPSARSFKILQVIASADPQGGGPIEGVLRQSDVLAKLGVETSVATLDFGRQFDFGPTETIIHQLGDPQHNFGGHSTGINALKRYGLSANFVRWLRLHLRDYDIAILNGLWNFSSVGFLFSWRGQNTPFVIYPHGMLDPWFRKTYPLKHLAKQIFWWLGDGGAINNANAVLFTCEEERQQAREAFWPYHPRELIVPFGSSRPVVANAETAAAFAVVTPRLNGRPYLLFLSRIHRKKGVDLLIEAFARVAASRPDLDLVIAGPDQEELRQSLEGRAAALGLADRLHWPGMLQGEAKWGAYHGCEAFVLPSHQENFGIVVAEALSCGKPVLISDKVNIWREIAAAGAGFVASDTVEGTTDNLRAFLALDRAARADMAKRAQRCFDENFDVTEAALKTLDILKAVAERRLNLPRYGERNTEGSATGGGK